MTRGGAPVKRAIDAVYENGAFRPLRPDAVGVPEGQLVRITIDDQGESEALRLAVQVFDGLSEEDIDEVERIALDRSVFFGTR